MTYFKNNIASLFGVKSAVVAQYLFDNIFVLNEGCCIAKREGKAWCRCSKVHLTSVFPFYSRHQISDAIDILIEGKVLKKSRLTRTVLTIQIGMPLRNTDLPL